MKLSIKLCPLIDFVWRKIEIIFNELTFSTDAKKASLIMTIIFETALVISITHVWLVLVFVVSAGGFFYAMHKLLSDFLERDHE